MHNFQKIEASQYGYGVISILRVEIMPGWKNLGMILGIKVCINWIYQEMTIAKNVLMENTFIKWESFPKYSDDFLSM